MEYKPFAAVANHFRALMRCENGWIDKHDETKRVITKTLPHRLCLFVSSCYLNMMKLKSVRNQNMNDVRFRNFRFH